MRLFTQYNRITLWALVFFFLLSSLAYYFLMRGLLFRELDLSLTKVERRVRDYVQTHHSFPAGVPMDDLRITHTEVPLPGPRNLRLIPPTPGKNSDNIRELDFFLQLDQKWFKVTASRNLEGMKGTAQLVTRTAAITLLAILAASIIANRLLFRKLWQPFYESIAVIGQFQLGKQTLAAFPVTKIEEFNFMNDQFRQMAATINKEYLVLKEFTENASHEMQTPLAVIRSKLDLAIQDHQLSEAQSATLQSAYASVKKLTSLNRSLLLIAKISNNQYDSSTRVNIQERLQDKIVQFRELWEGKLTITGDLCEAEIEGNPDLVDILLNNLFSNAGRHNIPDGEVKVQLTPTSLEIKNTGRPVPLDESRMFRRFYKGSGQEESNGLGLSILKEICDLSGITPSYSFSGNIHAFFLKWNGPDR
jgi:signal transduction histidine kinase